jgi:hypothetical protein
MIHFFIFLFIEGGYTILCSEKNQNINMSKLTKRNITSTKFPGWILPPTEAMPLGKSLISLNAPRWSRSRTSIKRRRSLCGRLRRMMRKMKSFLIGMFSQ